MTFAALFLALGFGVVSTLPVGPVGYLAIEGAVSGGRAKALRPILGLLAAESLYLLFALYFFDRMNAHSIYVAPVLRIFSAPVLIWMGVRLLLGKRAFSPGGSSNTPFLEGFLITLFNPAILLLYLGLLSHPLVLSVARMSRRLFILLVFLGASVTTLYAMAFVGEKNRHRLEGKEHVINAVAGILIGLFGFILLFHGIKDFL
jgi:threonine/homoserine/homoserine lactone efflux protein